MPEDEKNFRFKWGKYMKYKIFEYDPLLEQYYEDDFDLRMNNFARKKSELLKESETLADFANGYEIYGFHKTEDGWLVERSV